MRKAIIKKGDKYNRLTAVSYDHKNKWGQAMWLFRCDCGIEKVIQVNAVKRGGTKSCGCLQKELIRQMKIIHGMSYSREYRTWLSMKDRCYNKNYKKYKNYGGRGIKVCDKWKNSFENFYADMGKRPTGKTLDRINNNLGYNKDNCRWASMKEQANNRRDNHRITYNGKTMTIAQWTSREGLNSGVLLGRLKSGWSIERSLKN